MKKEKVLIIAAGSYPFGSPMALRLRAFTKLFRKINFEVIVLCDKVSNEVSLDENKSQFDNIKIYSLDGKKNKLNIKKKFKIQLDNVIKEEKPDVIFSNCINARYSIIKKLAEIYRIPIIINSVEWYDPSTFKFGRFSNHYISFMYCWNFLYPKANGCVAISKTIENHYKKYMDNVIRIPTIVDDKNIEYRTTIEKSCDTIKLLFAGSLARTKDSIKEFFFALDFLDENQKNKIQFEICGLSVDELKKHIGNDIYNKYKKQINIYGKIPQSKIADMYLNSDYGIFLRPHQRSSDAGFSTKLGEGMILGTPFIINNTSDIQLYIKDKKNGFIIEKDISKIADLFKYILNLNNEERVEIRKNARETAEKYFYYGEYIDEFQKFINNVRRDYNNEKI